MKPSLSATLFQPKKNLCSIQLRQPNSMMYEKFVCSGLANPGSQSVKFQNLHFAYASVQKKSFVSARGNTPVNLCVHQASLSESFNCDDCVTMEFQFPPEAKLTICVCPHANSMDSRFGASHQMLSVCCRKLRRCGSFGRMIFFM